MCPQPTTLHKCYSFLLISSRSENLRSYQPFFRGSLAFTEFGKLIMFAQVRYIVESVESIYQGKEHSELRKATDMLVARQKVCMNVCEKMNVGLMYLCVTSCRAHSCTSASTIRLT